MWVGIYRVVNYKNHLKIEGKIILFTKRMTWQLMWRNVRVTELNAMLQLLVIYWLGIVNCATHVYTWVISALGCPPYDFTSKTCLALVDANNNRKEIVTTLKFFPILLLFISLLLPICCTVWWFPYLVWSYLYYSIWAYQQ